VIDNISEPVIGGVLCYENTLGIIKQPFIITKIRDIGVRVAQVKTKVNSANGRSSLCKTTGYIDIPEPRNGIFKNINRGRILGESAIQVSKIGYGRCIRQAVSEIQADKFVGC